MLLATITTASAAITITTPTAYTGCFLHEGGSNTIYGFVAKNLASIQNGVLVQKIWLFYKTSEKHHNWDIYML
jgi:hypothetical protein